MLRGWARRKPNHHLFMRVLRVVRVILGCFKACEGEVVSTRVHSFYWSRGLHCQHQMAAFRAMPEPLARPICRLLTVAMIHLIIQGCRSHVPACSMCKCKAQLQPTEREAWRHAPIMASISPATLDRCRCLHVKQQRRLSVNVLSNPFVVIYYRILRLVHIILCYT